MGLVRSLRAIALLRAQATSYSLAWLRAVRQQSDARGSKPARVKRSDQRDHGGSRATTARAPRRRASASTPARSSAPAAGSSSGTSQSTTTSSPGAAWLPWRNAARPASVPRAPARPSSS
jgi:hypothetical protein